MIPCFKHENANGQPSPECDECRRKTANELEKLQRARVGVRRDHSRWDKGL